MLVLDSRACFLIENTWTFAKIRMNSSSSQQLLDEGSSLTGKPIVVALLIPLFTFGVTYLASWVVSPLKGFPGPVIACEFCKVLLLT